MQTRRKWMLIPVAIQRKKAGTFSPGESAPADRALVSVELLESELTQCGCLYRGPCILSATDVTKARSSLSCSCWRHLAPASLPSLFTVNTVLTIEISRCKQAHAMFGCTGRYRNWRLAATEQACRRAIIPEDPLPLTSSIALK